VALAFRFANNELAVAPVGAVATSVAAEMTVLVNRATSGSLSQV